MLEQARTRPEIAAIDRREAPRAQTRAAQAPITLSRSPAGELLQSSRGDALPEAGATRFPGPDPGAPHAKMAVTAEAPGPPRCLFPPGALLSAPMGRARSSSTPPRGAAELELEGAPAALIYDAPADEGPTPEQVLAQFFGAPQKGEVTCSIFEIGGAKERGFLFAFPFSEAPPAHELYAELLAKYGPGRYEIFAQDAGGKLVTRKIFQVGTERDRRRAVIPDRRSDDSARAPVAAAPASPSMSPELAAILAGQQKILEALLARATEPPPREAGVIERAREFAELRSLFAPAAPTPTADILGIVKDVLKLKDELADDTGGSDSSPLAVALRQFGPVLSRAVEKLAGPPAPSSRAAPGAQAQGTAPASIPQAAAPRNGNSEGFAMNFDAVFAELAAHAEKGTAAPDVADAVLDRLANGPAWIEAAVLGMIAEEGDRVINRVVGSYPKLAPRREWLSSVVASILEKLEAADAEAPASPGAPDPEPPTHARSS